MQWVILIAVIVVLLTIDLLLHRGNHEPTASGRWWSRPRGSRAVCPSPS